MPTENERKVKELMIPINDYGTVFSEQSIQEAFKVLDRTGHRAVLVLDRNNEPTGLVSVRDILLGMEPKYSMRIWGESWFTLETFKNYPVFYYDGKFSGQCKAQAQKKVKEIMSPLDLTISRDATLAEAVHMMAVHNVGRLPVKDGDKVVGMIRIIEIFNELKRVVLEQ